jgi:hypothetical protein
VSKPIGPASNRRTRTDKRDFIKPKPGDLGCNRFERYLGATADAVKTWQYEVNAHRNFPLA